MKKTSRLARLEELSAEANSLIALAKKDLAEGMLSIRAASEALDAIDFEKLIIGQVAVATAYLIEVDRLEKEPLIMPLSNTVH